MKHHKILYSKEAFRDLDEIWEYIASVLQNRSAASRMIDRILDTVDQLKEFPKIGALLSSIADIESDYRFLVTENYLTFYRTDGSNIYIDRILYGRRDYLRVLFEKPEESSHHD